MLFDAINDLNWLAIIVATLAYFVVGAVWFSDGVMGPKFREAAGVTMPESGRPEARSLLTNAAAWFVVAVALGLVAKSVGADGFWDGVVLGLVVSIGFVATTLLVTTMYEGRNMAVWRIGTPANVIGYVVMGVILATWT